MTRPICTWTMPGRHLQPFVHSLTKLCRHTTLVQQCLSNGHQQISQCLSYTEPEDDLKARAYSTPKSRWKVARILNHLVKTPTPTPPAKVEEMRKDEKKILLSRNKHKGREKKHTQAKRALFIFVFFVRAIIKVLQS